MKKFVILLLAIVLTVCSSVSGTLAYVNLGEQNSVISTSGSVKIEQVVQEWNAEGTLMQPYTQNKPLYPCTGSLGWDTESLEDPAYRRLAEENAVDKYITVTNTGDYDAYVRTFIAFEMGDYSLSEFDIVGCTRNSCNDSAFPYPDGWEWVDEFAGQINGNNYKIMVAVHKNPVKPGETTVPSLLQVYLKNDVNGAALNRLDGNGDGSYDIRIYTEAVGASGFEDAKSALNVTFGDSSDPIRYHPWLPKKERAVLVTNLNELKSALMNTGGRIILASDIVIDSAEAIDNAPVFLVQKDTVLNLNGHKIVYSLSDTPYYPALFCVTDENVSFTIEGKGDITVNDTKMYAVWAQNGTVTINGGTFTGDTTDGALKRSLVYSTGGEITVNGGEFIYANTRGGANGGFDAGDAQVQDKLVIVLNEGVLLSNNAFRHPDSDAEYGKESDRIQLAQGCTLQEVTIDGKTWYKVVKQ